MKQPVWRTALPISRRRVLLAGALLAAQAAQSAHAATPTNSRRQVRRIDRQALVARHNVVLTACDGERPLQVGNGEFAFGMDITGLQTFAPFNTMSHWGWHEAPLPAGKKVEDYHMQPVSMHGREVPMPMPDPREPELSQWMTGNPHRINLGRIGLALTKSDGTSATQHDLTNTRQELDLWSGIVTSHFTLEGQPVTVTTACHPAQDTVAARIESPLVGAGRLAVFLDFPDDDTNQFNNFVGNWDAAGKPEMRMVARGQSAEFVNRCARGRKDAYHAALAWQGDAKLSTAKEEAAVLPLIIEKAEHGSGDKWLDATAALSHLVRDNRLALRVSNDLVGDPNLGAVKTLKLTYTAGAQRKSVELRAGQVLPKSTRRASTMTNSGRCGRKVLVRPCEGVSPAV